MIQDINTVVLSPLAVLLLLIICFVLMCVTIKLVIDIKDLKTNLCNILLDTNKLTDTVLSHIAKVINDNKALVSVIGQLTEHICIITANIKKDEKPDKA